MIQVMDIYNPLAEAKQASKKISEVEMLRIVKHQDLRTLVILARNPHITPRVMTALANQDIRVVTELAKNPKLTAGLVDYLIRTKIRSDDHRRLAISLLHNPNLNEKQLLGIAKILDSNTVLVEHPNCPASVLTEAYNEIRQTRVNWGWSSNDSRVEKIVNNKNCPLSILIKEADNFAKAKEKALAFIVKKHPEFADLPVAYILKVGEGLE